MNKTILKRSLATATSALIALGSLATSMSTVSAANSITIDKDWVLDVPVDAAVLPSPDALPAAAGSSEWGDLLNVWTTMKNGTSFVIAKDQVAAKAGKLLKKAASYVGDEAVDAVVNGLSDATATFVDDETVEITASLANVGEEVGKTLNKRIPNMDVPEEYLVKPDWSKLVVKGDVKATVKFDFTQKTVTVTGVFTDENGKKYTIDVDNAAALKGFVLGKKDEAIAILDASVRGTIANVQTAIAQAKMTVPEFEEAYAKFTKGLNDEEAKWQKALAKAESADAKIKDAHKTSDSFEECYAAIKAAAEAKAPKKASKYVDKLPNSWSEFLTAEKKGYSFNAAADYAEQFIGDVDIALTSQDLVDITTNAYDVAIAVDGYNASAKFSVAENAEDVSKLFDLYAATYADYFEANNVELVSVTSHKEVTMAYNNENNTFKYDVVRIIDAVETKELPKPVTTTTTEVTTTTETAPVTTTETAPVTTTETAPVTTTETAPVTTTETAPVTTTETAPVTTTETEPVTTTETAPVTTTETAPVTTTETAPVTTTETEPATTTSEEPITTTSTTVTTPDGPITTTTTTGQIEFKFSFETETNNIGYYWTEETDKFSCFESFSAKMMIFTDDNQSASTRMAMSDFDFVYDNAAAFKAEGYTIQPIKVVLTEEGAEKVNAIVQNGGYTDNATGEALKGVNAGDVIKTMTVTLVQRGNTSISDTDINEIDATFMLKYFAQVELMGNKYYSEVAYQNLPGWTAGGADGKGDPKGVFYAADVNADGKVTEVDATYVLRYYAANFVMEEETSFDEILGKTVTHEADAHINPFYVMDELEQAEG